MNARIENERVSFCLFAYTTKCYLIPVIMVAFLLLHSGGIRIIISG